MIQEIFPHREEENITMMMSAAELELSAKEAEKLDYKSLFMEVKITISLLEQLVKLIIIPYFVFFFMFTLLKTFLFQNF